MESAQCTLSEVFLQGHQPTSNVIYEHRDQRQVRAPSLSKLDTYPDWSQFFELGDAALIV